METPTFLPAYPSPITLIVHASFLSAKTGPGDVVDEEGSITAPSMQVVLLRALLLLLLLVRGCSNSLDVSVPSCQCVMKDTFLLCSCHCHDVVELGPLVVYYYYLSTCIRGRPHTTAGLAPYSQLQSYRDIFMVPARRGSLP